MPATNGARPSRAHSSSVKSAFEVMTPKATSHVQHDASGAERRATGETGRAAATKAGTHDRGGAIASRGVPEPVIRWSTYPNAYERPLAGRVERHVMASELLADNPLGDPAERPRRGLCAARLRRGPERRYPSVYVIQGYTGAGPMWHNRSPFRPTFPEAVGRAVRRR